MSWRLRHARAAVAHARSTGNGTGSASTSRQDPPAGYLEAHPGQALSPLFEGIHPITGDQLLSSDEWEMRDLGYVGARLLGYLHRSAPISGALDVNRPMLPWASNLGQTVRHEGTWPLSCPGASIDHPQSDWVSSPPIRVSGWAMFASETVTRVELTLNDRFVARARLGLPRLDINARCGCPDASIAGWEHTVEEGELPAQGRVAIGGTVYGSAGGKLTLEPVSVQIAAGAEPASRGDRGAAMRSLRVLRGGREHKPLRVLAITHSLGLGGAQLYLTELLERLRPGVASITVAAPGDGPLRTRLEQAGIAVHLSPPPFPWTAEVYDGRVAELAAWAAPQAFDVVLVNTLSNFHGVEVASRLNLPSIFAIHESLEPQMFWREHLWPQDPRLRDRFEEALEAASVVIFEAEATRQLFLPFGEPSRYVTMPYGIDLAAIDALRPTTTRAAAREHLGLPGDARIVLCLGTIEPRKGQASLARAFGAVAERHRDTILALVGHNGDRPLDPYGIALARHLTRAPHGHRVLIAPMAVDPSIWHLAADVLVCSSDNESLPRVILEAMAFERPVIATDIFGIPEVITDGVTGFLCRARDEADLADALNGLLAGDHDLGPIVAAAAERVRARHDADRYALRFERVIRTLVQQPELAPSEAAASSAVG